MSSLDYQIEKFTQALYDLATGEDDCRSRVGTAYHRFWAIRLDEFPEPVRRDLRKITKLLTRLPGRDGYIIPDNLRKMKNRTAAKIADLILGVYFKLVELNTHNAVEKAK